MKEYRCCLLGLLLIVAPAVCRAQSEVVDDSFVPHLLPTTAVVVRVDTNKLELADSIKSSTAAGGNSSELIAALVADFGWLRDQLEGQAMFIMIDIPASEAQSPIRLLLPKVAESKQASLTEKLAGLNLTEPVLNGNFQVVTLADPKYELADKIRLGDAAVANTREPFLTAFEEVKGLPIQVAVVPPKYLWRTYEELFEQLPKELGGGPMTRVTQGFQWGAIGLDFKNIDAKLMVDSASAEAAEAFAELLPTLAMNMLKQIAGSKSTSLQVAAAALRPMVKSSVEGDKILVRLDRSQELTLTVSMMVGAADMLLSPLMSSNITQKLKQIGLAIHNYESAMGSLPPAAKMRGEDGKSGLSWRVHILPYVGELELYNQFKLDQPWDSEHNKPLVARMPNIYRIGAFRLSPVQNALPEGYTTLVAPVGEGTMFGAAEVTTLGKVTDGLSNTVMVVQVKPELAVPWTAPEDYAFEKDHPASGLFDNDGTGYRWLLGDGAVVFVPVETSAQILLRLFEMNDGQPVQF